MRNLTKIIALLLVFASLFTLAACGDNNKTDDETKKETTTKAEETTGEDTTAEDTTAEDTTAEDTTAEDTTVADTTAADTTVPPVTTTTPPVTTTPTPELGLGSKTDPYLEIPTIGTSSMSVTTVSIPAGKSLFYSIYRVGGMVVTVNNANAYIVCDGKRYDAANGTLSFIAPAALASDAVSFEVGNKGGSAATFTLVFTNLLGTQANPQIITNMGNNISVSLPAGDSDGYNYKYKAEKAGTIRFTLTASAASIITVTNNRNSVQQTYESDSTEGNKYIDIAVNAGDEIVIVVGAKPNQRGKYPAANITWSGKFI